MILPFTFPAPLEAFIIHQEQIIGRPLSEREREVTAAWLPVINKADPESIQAVDELIAQYPSDVWINHFLTAVKKWMEVKVNG